MNKGGYSPDASRKSVIDDLSFISSGYPIIREASLDLRESRACVISTRRDRIIVSLRFFESV